MPNRALVVGGGMAGITSALLLRSRGWSVSLVESSPQLGGLLRSYRNEAGLKFDYGIHIPCSTGVPELDELLFASVRTPYWLSFDKISARVFFARSLNTNSQFIDVRLLPAEALGRVTNELSGLSQSDQSYSNAAEQLECQYGPALTRLIFAPILRKFFKRELCELTQNAHLLFGLSAFVIGSENVEGIADTR